MTARLGFRYLILVLRHPFLPEGQTLQRSLEPAWWISNAYVVRSMSLSVEARYDVVHDVDLH